MVEQRRGSAPQEEAQRPLDESLRTAQNQIRPHSTGLVTSLGVRGKPSPLSKRYSSEFRRDAVALVRDGEDSIPDVAARLGVAVQSLRNWVKEAAETADDEDPQRELDESEREELKRLRGRVRVLTRERDILKQALALMARSDDDN
jgi:transposase